MLFVPAFVGIMFVDDERVGVVVTLLSLEVDHLRFGAVSWGHTLQNGTHVVGFAWFGDPSGNHDVSQ